MLRARAHWTATTLGAAFVAYELERSDDGITFQRIARITSETIVQFDDWEARNGVDSWWRIRVRRNDGAVSAYSWAAAAGPTNDGICFVTNEQPDLNVNYPDRGETREYVFTDQSDQVVYELQGRDFGAAFTPLERRGDKFTLELLLDKMPGGLGRRIFDAVLELVRTPLSYVCVKDSHGGRWFALVQVAKGTLMAPAPKTAVVTVTEITQTPSTPDGMP